MHAGQHGLARSGGSREWQRGGGGPRHGGPARQAGPHTSQTPRGLSRRADSGAENSRGPPPPYRAERPGRRTSRPSRSGGNDESNRRRSASGYDDIDSLSDQELHRSASGYDDIDSLSDQELHSSR